VGGFLALREREPHQWQREESIDCAHKAGQGAQGKQRRLTEVFAECSSTEPGSASKLPGSGVQTLYFSFVQRIDSECLQQRVLSFQGCSFLGFLQSSLTPKHLHAGSPCEGCSSWHMTLGHFAPKAA